MEHQPPPLFKTGPTPQARLFIFSMLSLALLVADAKLNYLNALRQVAAVVIYPVQRVAVAPAGIARRIGDFFVTHGSLREDNARLTVENRNQAAMLQQLKALEAENSQLRGLLGARERLGTSSTPADVLYAARDPFSRKVVIDKGSQHDLKNGQPVIDNGGVIGQITRTYPWLSEVTLITDKDHLVPVLNVRNGLRAVLAGTGNDGALELRFVPLNADFQNGDPLVTSGIDGIYPPGLPVALVSNVERNAAFLFAKITCKPVGGVNSNTHVLVVTGAREMPERPSATEQPARQKKSRKGG